MDVLNDREDGERLEVWWQNSKWGTYSMKVMSVVVGSIALVQPEFGELFVQRKDKIEREYSMPARLTFLEGRIIEPVY